MADQSRPTDGSDVAPAGQQRFEQLAAEWNQRQQQPPGSVTVPSLHRGLETVRDLLYTRVHEDVESNIGSDSMLIPVAVDKIERRAKTEIALYQVAESTRLVRASGWVGDADWYLDWLSRLLFHQPLGERRALTHIKTYLSLADDDRRLEFTRVLQKTIAEAAQAPLVLYRILPLAIQIGTAVAFDQMTVAQSLRDQQLDWLPAIRYCQDCHGLLLGNGVVCDACGNPIWKYRWLTDTG